MFCLLLLLTLCTGLFLRLEAQESDRPNILFAIADDASFPHMSAYGCEWIETPFFDRVASEGILFQNAYTPNAKCAPSRSIIITGRNSWQLEAAANHWPFFPAHIKSVFEVLKENGYFTGYTQKGWGPGIALDKEGNPRELTGKKYNDAKIEPPTQYMAGNDYAGNFETFLSEKPKGQPFCFWYGSVEPHRKYEFQSGVNKGKHSLASIDRVPAFWPDTDTVRHDMLDYAYEIEYFDMHLGKMIESLEEKGLMENTVIIVTSDNGMPFPRIKGQDYEISHHMPLAIMWKGGILNPGRTVEDFVSFADFAPTFLALAQIAENESGMLPITGTSLWDIFTSVKSGQVNPDRDYVLIGKERHDLGRPNDLGYPVRGIVKDGYLYVRNLEPDRWPGGNPETGYMNTDGGATKTQVLNGRTTPGKYMYWQWCFGRRPSEEFFDIRNDPDCIINLAYHPVFFGKKRELISILDKELIAQKDPRAFGKGYIFDQYPYSDEKSRGFYERFMKKEEGFNAGWINKTDVEPKPLD